MERQAPVRTEEVARLRTRFTRGTAIDPSRDAEWAGLRSRPFGGPRALADYHDLLLFILAFPWSRTDHGIATAELDRAAELVGAMVRHNEARRYALMNSGIAGTPSRAAFGLDLVRWLSQRADVPVELDELDGESTIARMIWAAACGRGEREAAEDERRSVLDSIMAACGDDRAAALRELVAAIDRLTPEHDARNALWEAMKPTITFTPGRSPLTRTWARGVERGIALRRADRQAAPDVRTLPSERPAPDEKLTAAETTRIQEAARGVLVGHLRETDTAVLCDAGAIDLRPMGEGIHVALLPLPAGRRMPFDAYVGYVAFVNAMPVAYGGAWIFPGRSKIGVNVFPAYRGGPSAWLFARIIQCYAMRFGVGRFEAENYQLGHGNPEGIRSGAYWFYDRLGFRTKEDGLAAMADAERAALGRDRSHRTPPAALRKLASRPMWLDLRREWAPTFDLVDLGEAVLRASPPSPGRDRAEMIAGKVDLVAGLLGAKDRSRWPVPERNAFEHLAPAMALIQDLGRWPAAEKRSMVALMRAKGARTEDRYIALLRKHERLLSAWARIVGTVDEGH